MSEDSDCMIDVVADTCDAQFRPKLRRFFAGLEGALGCQGELLRDTTRLHISLFAI